MTMITDLIRNSGERNGCFEVNMSDEVYSAMTALREFLYENVYRSPQVHNEFIKAKNILVQLYQYLLENEELLRVELKDMNMDQCDHDSRSNERIVCDFIASMTDRSALDLYAKIFVPKPLV
jgi:dGTPase